MAAVEETNTNNLIRDNEMSITGADFLASSIRDRIKAAKQSIARATAETDHAISRLDGAADQASRVATQIENEAADLLAELGQFSNGGPE